MNRILILAITFSLFSSCNFENYITVHYSDLIDFLSNQKSEKVTLPISVKVEVSGDESCNKDKSQIHSLLKPYFVDLQEGTCKSADMKTFLEMKGKFYMVKYSDSLEDIDYLVAFKIRDSAKFINIYVKLNQYSLDRINRYTEEKYWTKFKNKDLSVEIDFVNDSKTTQKITCRSCYLDGKPKPFFGFVDVEPKEISRIKLSTVLVEYLLEEKPEPVFTLNK
jgi:hypothetical protein